MGEDGAVFGPAGAVYEHAFADRVLEAAETRLSGKWVGTIQRVTEHGDAAKRISEVAKRERVDPIVLGTRGSSDIRGPVLGSVARKVAHAAPCTVVSVH